MKTLPRFITPRLLEALRVSPVVFLIGARQTGKSTLVLNNLNKIGTESKPAVYFSFDSVTQIAAATAAPEAFLTAGKSKMVIDEVQLVPELFRSLKQVVDELRLNCSVISWRILWQLNWSSCSVFLGRRPNRYLSKTSKASRLLRP